MLLIFGIHKKPQSTTTAVSAATGNVYLFCAFHCVLCG